MRRALPLVVAVSLLLWSSTASLTAAEADADLVQAAKQQDWEAVHALIAQEVDVNTAHADGATALHWAAFWNDLDTVDRLIRGGANVDAQNDYGATPLWCACSNRHTKNVVRQIGPLRRTPPTTACCPAIRRPPTSS